MVEYTMVQMVATVLGKASNHLQIMHTKVHQDNNTHVEAFSILARLNILADRLATTALQ